MVVENRYPPSRRAYELIADSSGSGRFRSGLGVRIDYRVLSENTTVAASLDRFRIRPPGVFGGGDGALSGLFIDTGDGVERPAHNVAGLPVPQESLVTHHTGGGGYVSEEAARELYGYAPAAGD